MVFIKKVPADSPDALALMEELSDALAALTGSGGNASFRPEDMRGPRSVFAVAYEDGEPVGCGAIREYAADTAELKRMYARCPGRGIGRQVLVFLEREAAALHYARIILETRKINKNAVGFYLANGYAVCPNCGRYTGREDAVCFSKMLARKEGPA